MEKIYMNVGTEEAPEYYLGLMKNHLKEIEHEVDAHGKGWRQDNYDLVVRLGRMIMLSFVIARKFGISYRQLVTGMNIQAVIHHAMDDEKGKRYCLLCGKETAGRLLCEGCRKEEAMEDLP